VRFRAVDPGGAGGVTDGHPFETLYHDGEPVEVDVEVVPLIELCWGHGLDPLGSCQDEGGYVTVEFDGPHAERFLTLVAGENAALRVHIKGEPPWEVDPPRLEEYRRAHTWRYRAGPEIDEGGGFYMAVGIAFPRAQLATVVAALEDAPREPEAA
jgi:hypothetical protein